MNKIVTLILLICSSIANGKTTGITIPSTFPHFGSSEPTANMGTSPVRLIGKIKMIYNGTDYIPFDSTVYSYSNGRGGILDLDYTDNFLNFDNAVKYEYDKITNNYNNSQRYTQTFHSNNKIQFRIQENWINNQVQWHNYVRHEYIYNSDQSRLEQTNIASWNGSWVGGNTLNYKLVYNGKDDIVEIQYVLSNTMLSYDVNHNVIERLEYVYTPGIGWDYSDKFNFSYNASNNLISYTHQKYHGGNWNNIMKQEYIYNGSELNKTVEYSWKNNIWEAARQNVFTYDIRGNKLSDDFQLWDNTASAFINTRREEWTYNIQNQPLTYRSLSWNAANQTWQPVTNDFLYRYQYEFYAPTSTNDIAAAKDLFIVYPQPASDVMNIRFKELSTNKYEGYIHDFIGKVVKSFVVNEKEHTVPINDLSSGNYLVSVVNNGKKATSPLLISR